MRDDFCGAGENEALLLSRGITNYGRSILPSIDTNRQQVHSRAFAETSDMHTENFFTLFLLLVRVRVLIFSASHTIPPDLSELKKHQVEVHKCFCKLLMGSSASEANFPARKSSFYNGLLQVFFEANGLLLSSVAAQWRHGKRRGSEIASWLRSWLRSSLFRWLPQSAA